MSNLAQSIATIRRKMDDSNMQKFRQQEINDLLGPIEQFVRKEEERMEKLLDPITLDEGVKIRRALEEAKVEGKIYHVKDREAAIPGTVVGSRPIKEATAAEYRVDFATGGKIVGTCAQLLDIIGALGRGKK